MSAVVARSPGAGAQPVDGRSTIRSLARADARRYARHPLFLVAVGLLLLSMVDGVRQQEQNGSPMNGVLLVAFLLGVFGFVVAHRLTTSLRRTGDLADTSPVGAQQRTVALLLACLVPAAAGCVFVVYMLVCMAVWPPVGIPATAHVAWFRDESDLAVLATLVALGPVAALGGPLLGVAVARWAPFRGSALVGVVTLVVLVALPSDAGPPWMVLPPWPILYDEHANEREQLTDSSLIEGIAQGWVLVYLLCLCGLAAVAALLRDPPHRRQLVVCGAALTLGAVASFLLAVS
jgi:hypothetical protein